jgi:Flp pilus assembly protein TadG
MRIVKREAGQDLIEFALIAPILFVVLFGIVEFGVAVWRYNTLANTARETAREFVVYPEGQRDEHDIEEYARDYAWDVARIDVTPEFREERLVITSTTGITRSLPRLVVTVSYTHSTITGLFGEVPMRARASMLGEDAQ